MDTFPRIDFHVQKCGPGFFIHKKFVKQMCYKVYHSYGKYV